MVVQSIHSLNTCDNRIATTTNTSNCIIDVSPSNTSTTHLMMVSGVSFNEDNQTSSNPNNNSGTAARRSSARIQKLNREKALLRLSRTEESLKVKPPPPSQQERVSRKTTTRVYQRKKLHHQPNAVEKTTSELNTKTESSAAAAVNVDVGIAMVKNLGLTENGAMGDKSMHAMVTETLRTFNKHYLHFVQEEEKRCGRVEVDRKTTKGSKSKKRDAPVDDAKRGSKRPDLKALTKKGDAPEDDAKRGSKRPDLKALTKMMETNAILSRNKRFGSIPGIDVGHQFFSRAEMVAVGLHTHWLKGIDCISQSTRKGEYSVYTLPLAVAIVLSGQYEDDLDNCEDIVYTGEGGNNLLGNRRQIRDQIMERGNLGLKNCMEQCVPVRVIRGHRCPSSYVGKVYTYDGLYKVVNYWAEKGVSGFTVYKFRLKRLEGQPLLTTSQVLYGCLVLKNSYFICRNEKYLSVQI